MKRDLDAVSISRFLVTAAFVSFLPLFIWKSRLLLAIVAGLTWIAFTYLGTMALFGSRSTVIAIMWHERKNPPDNEKHIYGRFFGGLILAFMIVMTYEIFQDGLTTAYNNFGR